MTEPRDQRDPVAPPIPPLPTASERPPLPPLPPVPRSDALFIRGIDGETSAQLKRLASARGWTLAVAVRHLVDFVREAQSVTLNNPSGEPAADVRPLLEKHGLGPVVS